MREDFLLAKEQLDRIGILRVAADFYQTPTRRGSVYFVRSPSTDDKTASLALYPSSNRFVDYAAGGKCGDTVGLVAYVRGWNQWEALKELQAYYGLDGSKELERGEEAKRKIQRQQAEERRKAERQQAFENALNAEIDNLREWLNVLNVALEREVYEPFSDLWCYCCNEREKAQYKLDLLTASDKSYFRLKDRTEFSSDKPRWIMDCFTILSELGTFQATEKELKEIKAQRDFELTKDLGQERR